MRYWNEPIETMSRDELRSIQDTRLRRTVEKIYTNVEHYRKKMQDKGLLPGDVRGAEDLRLLPFSTKQDLRDTYPYGMFSAPLDQITRIHASSGTTGKQTVVGYTAKDIEIWAECMARCLVMAGQDKRSRVQVSYGYGLFTGGLGAHYGAERLGASTIPTSSGNTQRQIVIMRDFGSTCLCCTPSYALFIAETMEDMGIKKEELSLQAGCFGAEPWTEGMRRQIEDRLGIRAHDIYGLSEIMGPSVSQDCECKAGLHVWEDYFIPEIIDPATGEVLPDGAQGEIVFTTISKEGMPLIRYRTRDISSLTHEVCACGRTHARMGRLKGRTDDMLIIRGVNVFPSQIESVLLGFSNVSPNYRIIVEREGLLDQMTIELEINETLFADTVKGMEDAERGIRRQLDSVLGITSRVRIVEKGTIDRSMGKAVRVIDKRNLIG
ncbi:MAG: phenylacetate--CoA ligase [Clostridiales bacterium]|jgi:phenylacetate-CoA ligase|nr:phenylacetate--CoA ligase [Clostridiales bacterium]